MQVMRMKRPLAFLTIVFIYATLMQSVFAQGSCTIAEPCTEKCIYFFWGEGCMHCASVRPFIEELKQKYSDLNVVDFEIYRNRDNLLLLEKYFDKASVPIKQRGVPAVIVENTILIGVPAIKENLEEKILKLKTDKCPSLESETFIYIAGTHTSELKPEQEHKEGVSLLVITLAALADSINPCAIAVLLILLMGLLAAGDKKRALRAGIAFSTSIYIVYFLFGLGIFSALQFALGSFSQLRSIFYIIIGIFGLLIGIFNIKDYFWYGAGGFVMEIPRSWRPTVRKLLNSVTTPLGAFLIGFVICLFELPCTGGPYFFILGLLAKTTTRMQAIPLLLYYNLFFILPLLIITLLVGKGADIEAIDDWKSRNIKKIHLATGIVMLILAAYVFWLAFYG
jgi:cytochrome c biogenesis protein CcdA